MKITVFVFVIIFCACKSNNAKPNDNSQGNEQFISRGVYGVDSLEEGQWKFFDQRTNEIIEEGNFSLGIRTGVWKYYGLNRDSISWRAYSNNTGTIKTNIPIYLKNVEDSDSLIRFINQDSIRLFNLLIAKGYVADSTSFETYLTMIYDDLASRNILIIDSSSTLIETGSTRNYLYNHIIGKEVDGAEFIIFNLMGTDEIGKKVEISVRCRKEYNTFGQKVFFSIIPNLFINSKRFLLANDKIISLSD